MSESAKFVTLPKQKKQGLFKTLYIYLLFYLYFLKPFSYIINGGIIEKL